MDKRNTTKYDTIDLLELLGVMWRNKLIIIACALVASVISFICVQYLTDDTYSSSGILYVSNKNRYSTTVDDSINGSDIDTSRTLSTSYMEVLKTTSFLMSVSDEIGNKYSWAQIGSMMSVSSVNDTELLKITVVALNPDDAYEVASAIMTCAPGKLTAIFKGGEVEIADPPLYPSGPNSKGKSRKIVLGFILGAVVGALICFLLYFFDTKVHKADDIAKRYNVSILGELAQ